MNYRISLFLTLAILFISCKGEKSSSTESVKPTESPWLLGFEKTKINPIMQADSSYTFLDPISNKEVQWQKAGTQRHANPCCFSACQAWAKPMSQRCRSNRAAGSITLWITASAPAACIHISKTT